MADEPNDQISAKTLRNVLQAEIGNRQSERHQVQTTLNRLDAEIMALMLAQDRAERLAAQTKG